MRHTYFMIGGPRAGDRITSDDNRLRVPLVDESADDLAVSKSPLARYDLFEYEGFPIMCASGEPLYFMKPRGMSDSDALKALANGYKAGCDERAAWNDAVRQSAEACLAVENAASTPDHGRGNTSYIRLGARRAFDEVRKLFKP